MIEATSLSKRFGPVRAVDRVELKIPQGANVALMGPNGSGKSTLLRLIAGLARPTSGEVLVGGAPPRSMKASIGYLGHDHCLYPFLTVTENLDFYCDLYRVDHSRAQALIDALDLRSKASTAVRELSRGFAQRVAIARALLHEPRYLLLDEPFNALDGSTAKLIPSAIAAPGRTLLLVTHDEARAGTITDEVIRMDAGRVQ